MYENEFLELFQTSSALPKFSMKDLLGCWVGVSPKCQHIQNQVHFFPHTSSF